MEFFILLFFIICCILLIINILKKHKYLEIDKEIIEKNKILFNNKEILEKEIKFLNETKENKQIDLDRLNNIIQNMNAAARESFAEYCDSLDQEYKNIEKEHDDAIDSLRYAYDQLQDILIYKTKKQQEELDKISATRAAAMEAQLKEEEIKNKKSFYCPQISEDELKDAKTLKDIEYKLNNPRILRMLI